MPLAQNNMTHIDYIFLVGDFLVAIGLVVGFKWALIFFIR